MEKVVEVLVYDQKAANEDFETFLLKVVERLKALRYCSRLIIRIVRGVEKSELQVELEDLSTSRRDDMAGVDERVIKIT